MPNNDQPIWMKTPGGSTVPVDPGDVSAFTKLGYTPSNAPAPQGTVAMTPAGPASSQDSDSFGIGPFQMLSPAPMLNPANWASAWQKLKAGFQGAPPTVPSNLPENAPALAEQLAVVPGTRIPLQQGLSEASSISNLGAFLQGRAPGAVTRPMLTATQNSGEPWLTVSGTPVPESKYFVPPSSTVMVNGQPAQVPLGTLPTGGTRALPLGAEMFRSGIPGLQGAGSAALGAAGAAARAPLTLGQEMMGRGPSMAKLRQMKFQEFWPVKGALESLDKVASKDASNSIETAISMVDRDAPQGVVSKEASAAEIKEAVAPLEILGKSPGSVTRVTGGPGKTPELKVFGQPVSEIIGAATRAAPGEDAKVIMNRFMTQIGQDPLAITPAKGWSMRELQQIRTQSWNEMTNGVGPSKVAAGKVYQWADTELNSAADRYNVRNIWEDGNSKWQKVQRTFRDSNSPIARAMAGNNADEIMGPLRGANEPVAKKLLNQYIDYGYSPKQFDERTALYDRLTSIERSSVPSAWVQAMAFGIPARAILSGTLGNIAGGFGGYAAYRMLGPILQRYLALRGFKPQDVMGMDRVQPGVPQQPPIPNRPALPPVTPPREAIPLGPIPEPKAAPTEPVAEAPPPPPPAPLDPLQQLIADFDRRYPGGPPISEQTMENTLAKASGIQRGQFQQAVRENIIQALKELSEEGKAPAGKQEGPTSMGPPKGVVRQNIIQAISELQKQLKASQESEAQLAKLRQQFPGVPDEILKRWRIFGIAK